MRAIAYHCLLVYINENAFSLSVNMEKIEHKLAKQNKWPNYCKINMSHSFQNVT